MYNDDVTRSIAKAAQEVLEGYGKKKMKKEEAKYPHDMFHPETGEKEVAKDEAEHKALAKKGYTHEKPDVAEVAEPIAKGEKDFKAKHKIKKSGENEDGSVVKEAKKDDEEEVDEQSEKQKKYQAFFQKALKKFGVDSPADLGDKKKEFFDYVDKNYNADNESDVDESLIGSIKKAAGAVKKKVKRAAMGKVGRAQADFDQGRKDDLDPSKRIAKKKEQIKGYVEKLKAAEKKNKEGKMDDDTLEDREDYYNGLINKAEDYIDELESQM
jgi:hypothetical protein